MKLLDEEKRRLKEEMNKTLELERDKIKAQHKLDTDHKDIQHLRAVEAQKRMHEE